MSAQERAFRAFLEEKTGFEIPEDRWRFLAPRFLARLEGRGFARVEDYLRHLEGGPLGRTELEEIFTLLTVRKTSFFRNPASFEALSQDVFPNIVRQRRSRLPVAIWSAGCSTGEEPYSIAMVAEAVLGALSRPYYVLATDIVQEALATAREGSYPSSVLGGVPPDYRRYLELVGGRLRVSEQLRGKSIEFAEHNLVHDTPPASAVGLWDVIFCRNVFIYFAAPVALEILRGFAGILSPGGALFLGHAEVFPEIEDLFEVVFRGNTFYYRKRITAAEPEPEPEPESASPDDSELTPDDERARQRAAFRTETRAVPRPLTRTRRFHLPHRRPRSDQPLSDTSTRFRKEPHQTTPTRAFKLPDVPSTGLEDTRAFPRSALRTPLPYDLLAKAARQMGDGDREGAARTLRAACNRAPRWERPRIALARLYLDRDERLHAIRELEVAVEIRPLEPLAHYLLGSAHAADDRHARAEVYFRRALYLEPDFVRVRYALALSLRAQDQIDRACRELRNAMRSMASLDRGRLEALTDGMSLGDLRRKVIGEMNQLGGSFEETGLPNKKKKEDTDER